MKNSKFTGPDFGIFIIPQIIWLILLFNTKTSSNTINWGYPIYFALAALVLIISTKDQAHPDRRQLFFYPLRLIFGVCALAVVYIEIDINSGPYKSYSNAEPYRWLKLQHILNFPIKQYSVTDKTNEVPIEFSKCNAVPSEMNLIVIDKTGSYDKEARQPYLDTLLSNDIKSFYSNADLNGFGTSELTMLFLVKNIFYKAENLQTSPRVAIQIYDGKSTHLRNVGGSYYAYQNNFNQLNEIINAYRKETIEIGKDKRLANTNLREMIIYCRNTLYSQWARASKINFYIISDLYDEAPDKGNLQGYYLDDIDSLQANRSIEKVTLVTFPAKVNNKAKCSPDETCNEFVSNCHGTFSEPKFFFTRISIEQSQRHPHKVYSLLLNSVNDICLMRREIEFTQIDKSTATCALKFGDPNNLPKIRLVTLKPAIIGSVNLSCTGQNLKAGEGYGHILRQDVPVQLNGPLESECANTMLDVSYDSPVQFNGQNIAIQKWQTNRYRLTMHPILPVEILIILIGVFIVAISVGSLFIFLPAWIHTYVPEGGPTITRKLCLLGITPIIPFDIWYLSCLREIGDVWALAALAIQLIIVLLIVLTKFRTSYESYKSTFVQQQAQ